MKAAVLIPLSLLIAIPATAAGGVASRQADRAPNPSGEIVIRPAAKPSPERQRRMERWHRTYTEQVGPLREIADRLRRAASRERLPTLGAECRALDRALSRLERQRFFPVPEFSVHRHLASALDHLAGAAAACGEHRWAVVPHELDQAERAFGHAALSLRRFGLEP